MADPHANMTQATPQEVIISLLAGLFAPLLAIFLIVQLVLGIQEEQQPDTTSEAAQKATLSRIKPFAQLVALDANAPRVEKSGQAVYDAVCASCHTSGALGAPKFEDKGGWGPRLGQGFDTLVKHAIDGIRQMPPRGGDGDLSDVEVARAVAYMTNSAGASFEAPEGAAPAAAADTAGATEAAAPAAAATTSKPDPAKGKAVYESSCAVCHAAGVAGAPKPGDKAAWATRVSQGYATLYDHALNGIRGMPPKGGNADLSEADLADAVGYLFAESGGKL
ncbi:c-type cytochrome [Thiobacillus denitrificans]|uniref:Cytochrome C n=1 Tax=Thiobacillus denitrificans TaxID=36861 RepID=A0A106BPF7_THIDE|nr:c-type cytochrome [Thiobacillus denitrificans]KVW96220.1 cytochrome C [Thiobacillus denitrificans]